MHDHDIYDNTPSSYLDDIADIREKHIRLSYPNFILLLARLDTDYSYAQYLVRCLYAKHLADELRHPTAILKYGCKSSTNICGSTKNTVQPNSAAFYSGRGTTPPELKLLL